MSTNAKSIRKKAKRQNSRSDGLIWTGIIIVALAGWVAWSIFRSSTSASTPTGRSGVQVGDIASDFSVPTLDGGTFTLSEQRGNPTVVFFMAYWCGSCIPEGTALGQIIQEYGNKVSIVAINIDPSATWGAINQFKQAAGNGAFAWAWDTDQKVTTAYQVTALDTTLILDGEGRIVYRDELPTQYETLKAELEKLIQ